MSDSKDLIDQLSAFGAGWVQEAAERAKANVDLARDRRYGLSQWLDDSRWFWDKAAEGTMALVEGLRSPPEAGR